MEEFKCKDHELFWLWGSFRNELAELYKFISKKNANNLNRVFVRSLFSMVEGVSYRIRQILLQRYNSGEIKLTDKQVIVLSEKKESEKKNIWRRYNSFEGMFKYTFMTYCSLYKKGNIYNKFISNQKFQSFITANGVRNRITHPKTSNDVFVSGADMNIIDEGYEWFNDFVIEAFEGDLLVN